jgi:hypothetical protein
MRFNVSTAIRDLALLSNQGASSQLRSDQMLVSTDRCFDQAASAITGCPLPTHAALLRNKLDVLVALALWVITHLQDFYDMVTMTQQLGFLKPADQ